MSIAKFSIVGIMKNERNVLPRMFDSLHEFQNKYKGEIVLLDTGSSDGSAEYARSRGATVHEVGEKFITVIDESTAKNINDKFVVLNEGDIVKAGNKLFDFAAARNHVTSLASNDFVITLDCDEAYSAFNIEYINSLIDSGFEQLEYQFVYAHDAGGRPLIQFVQSKAFDRRKVKWVGVVHEVLSGNAKRIYVDQSQILLEHWQEPGKDHRGNYIVGLAVDCYNNPASDRNSHYFARELMYTGRPWSAIKEFSRHIEMNGWPAERAQSMIYIGDCYSHLGSADKQIEWYQKAFFLDPNRRESLIKSAAVMKHQQKWNGVAAYAAAALEIAHNDYYANDMAMYQHIPHELLYEAKHHTGDIGAARWHLMRCLDYQPYNPKFLEATKTIFEYPCSSIDGWFTYREQLWAYETGKALNGGKIVEIGSWKGRSSNAFLTGNKDGTVYCVDTWRGSEDLRDDTNWMAKQEDVFEVFKANTRQFNNLVIIRDESVKAAEFFLDESLDAVFIDAGHDYENVVADIKAWAPKVKKGGIISGHDYMQSWMGVIEGVNNLLGKPDEIHDTIWVKYKR